jgi:hypothetical protein
MMMKHFVFFIWIMATLATHQAIAADSGCFIQGSPAVENSDALFVRDENNILRKWQRHTKDGENVVCWKEFNSECWDVVNMNNITKKPLQFSGDESPQIRSDPAVYQEFQFDEESRLNKLVVQHVFARGERGHLLEWRWQNGADKWQLLDLTEAVGGRTIAGTPSRLSNGNPNLLSYNDGETTRRFFTTPTPDDHLLRWSLPSFDDAEPFPPIDNRVWSFVDLTNDSNGQTSAGNIVLDYWTRNILTRDYNGHIFVGWQPSNFYGAGKIDLTEAVENGPTIIGDPTGYGDWWDLGNFGFFQHIFARNKDGHLYEWRHIWEGEVVDREVIVDGVVVDAFPYSKVWRDAMQSGWELIALEGRTIKGDPAVYLTVEQPERDVVIGYLNVLARGSDEHLLKWSKSVVRFNLIILEISPIRDDIWVFEDLTNAVSGTIIKGDPTMAMMRSTIYDGAEAITERIFVEGENNHLLEWYREWESVEVKEGEEEPWNSIKPQNGWKVTYLTNYCKPTDNPQEQNNQGQTQPKSDESGPLN